MKKTILAAFLSVAVSVAFGQLKVNTNGSFGKTTKVPLIFAVDNVKAGSTGSASIMIFNTQGALAKQMHIQRQQQNVIINGSELTAGMNFYSLIVNGQEIDTKRMILT